MKTVSFPRGWLPAILWMVLIFGLSSIPGSTLAKVPVPDVSSYVHALEYSILGILLFRGFRHSFPEKAVFLLALIAASSAILFGASDEFHQIFVPGRCCDVADLIVDSVSGVLGILLYIHQTGIARPKK